jgi:hypothetical protein
MGRRPVDLLACATGGLRMQALAGKRTRLGAARVGWVKTGAQLEINQVPYQ